MIKIVGVTHVINLKGKIYAFLDYENPDAIAIELDQSRLNSLLNKNIQKIKFNIFGILGYMQKRIAETQNVMPGEEMLSAWEKGQMLKIPVFLIDQDIGTTYKKFKEEVRFREKLKIVFSLIFSFIPRKNGVTNLNDILNKENELIEQLRKSYPTFVKVLIDDREEYMVNKLKEIEKYGKIIAFVGDGHLNGLKRRLPNAEIITLKDFLNLNIPNNQFKLVIKI